MPRAPCRLLGRHIAEQGGQMPAPRSPQHQPSECVVLVLMVQLAIQKWAILTSFSMLACRLSFARGAELFWLHWLEKR